MIRYELSPTKRYVLSIYIQQTPKKFGGPKGHNWQMMDVRYSRSIVLPGMNGTWVTLKECKRRAMLAYLLWFVVRLLRDTDDPAKIDREFFDV